MRISYTKKMESWLVRQGIPMRDIQEGIVTWIFPLVSIYLRFFQQKVDIEWRNMCSIYSSNKAEHISEIIFRFHLVLWQCEAIYFAEAEAMTFRLTHEWRIHFRNREEPLTNFENCMSVFRIWYHSILKSIVNNNLKL